MGGTAFLAAGTGIYFYAGGKPIGDNIPESRRMLRDQKAIGEAVRADTAKPEDMAGKENVDVRGGDKVKEG